MKLRVLIEKDEQAGFNSATCAELNHMSSCGKTEAEAVDNLKTAILLMLEPIPEQFLTRPGQTVDYIELAV